MMNHIILYRRLSCLQLAELVLRTKHIDMCCINRSSCRICLDIQRSLSLCHRGAQGYLCTVPISGINSIRKSVRKTRNEEKVVLDLDNLLPTNLFWEMCDECSSVQDSVDLPVAGMLDAKDGELSDLSSVTPGKDP